MKLKESHGDIEVKGKLWAATAREIMHFASLFADRHVVGLKDEKSGRYIRSDGQRDACYAAKMKGYPIGVVVILGSKIRRGSDCGTVLSEYRIKIGLG